VLFRCRDAGLIAEMPVDTVKRLRDEHWGGYDDAEFRLFNPFVDVLVSLGAAVSYRWEPGEEIRYDRLLRRFGRCMPWFPLEAVAERVTPSTDPREATTRLLQFVAGGRRYRMDCDGTGSYVYGGDLAELLNRALEDARHPERFFCVRCDEQWVFVFGLPDVVHELARTIYLPLFDEPALLDDAARRFVEART
jgi:hypothetical protein